MMSKKALSFFRHNFSLFFYNINFSQNRSLLVQVPSTTTTFTHLMMVVAALAALVHTLLVSEYYSAVAPYPLRLTGIFSGSIILEPFSVLRSTFKS